MSHLSVCIKFSRVYNPMFVVNVRIKMYVVLIFSFYSHIFMFIERRVR